MKQPPTPESAELTAKPVKPRQTLEQQIEALEAKTKKLKDQLKEDQRREREKNAKAVLELLKAEKLEDFGIDLWKAKIADVRKLLASTNV